MTTTSSSSKVRSVVDYMAAPIAGTCQACAVCVCVHARVCVCVRVLRSVYTYVCALEKGMTAIFNVLDAFGIIVLF